MSDFYNIDTSSADQLTLRTAGTYLDGDIVFNLNNSQSEVIVKAVAFDMSASDSSTVTTTLDVNGDNGIGNLSQAQAIWFGPSETASATILAETAKTGALLTSVATSGNTNTLNIAYKFANPTSTVRFKVTALYQGD